MATATVQQVSSVSRRRRVRIAREGPASIVVYGVEVPSIGEGRLVAREQAIAAAVRACGSLSLGTVSILATSKVRWARMTRGAVTWEVVCGTYGPGPREWVVGVYESTVEAFGALEGACG